ncbi:MAG: hypothetical protein QXM12_00575 [Nitrososphaerota archaeon]
MPDTYTPLTPQSQWETTGFNFPNPGSVIRATPIRNLFQKLLNRTEYLKDLLKEARGGDLNWSDPLPSNIRDLHSRLSALESGSGGTTLAAHRSNAVLDHPDGSVTESKLANDAVTTVKIKDGAVTNAKISVTTALIPNLNADLLDGYHASDFPRKAENATITGSWTFSSSQTFNSSITVNSTITATGTITAPTLQGNNSSTLLLNARSQSLEARIAESGTGTRYFSVTSGSAGGTTLFQVGSDSKTRVRSTLIIDKVSGVARIEFPNETGGNDPGFIEHRETTADQAELRISISDNADSSSDYLVIGASPSGNFTGRLRIDTRGRLIFGNGTNWDAQIYRSAADTLTIDKHLSITNNLSVGGTTTLSGSLTSSGAATFANTLRISGTGAELIVGSDTPSNPNLRFLGNNSDGKAYIQAGKSNTDTQADLVISRYSTTNSAIRSLQIYSDASSFSGTLSVGGNASIFGDLTLTDVKKRIYSTVPIYEIRAISGSGQWILLGTFDIPDNFQGVRLDGKVYRAGAEAPISGSQVFVHIGREGNGSYTVRLGLYPTAIVSNEVSVYRFGILNDLAVVQTGQNTFSLYGKLIGDLAYILHASWNIAHNLSNYTLSQGDISRISSLPSPVTGGLSVVWSTDTNARRYLISDEHIEDNTISPLKLSGRIPLSKLPTNSTANRVLAVTTANSDPSFVQVSTDMVADGAITNAKLSSDRDSFNKVTGGHGTVDTNGNFGIGTSTPAEKLHVVGTVRIAPSAISGTQAGLTLIDPSTGAGEGLWIGWRSGSATNDGARIGYLSATSGGHLVFSTSNSTSAPSERMRITADGKVGIGTNAPSESLEVSGNVKATTFIGSLQGNADTATKLATARTISLSGDASGSASFDGSANATINVTLANSGVTAGTYTKVTVNSKGLVTSGSSLTASDLPSHAHAASDITSGRLSLSRLPSSSTADRVLAVTTANGDPSYVQITSSMISNGAVGVSQLADNATLKVQGDFIFDSVDWNTYKTAGIYRVSGASGSGGSNQPPATYKFGALVVLRGSNGAITQIYYPHQTDTNFYVRQTWDGTDAQWQPWRAYPASNYNSSISGLWSFTNGIRTNSITHASGFNVSIDSIGNVSINIDTDNTGSDTFTINRGPSNSRTELFRINNAGTLMDFGGSGTIYRNTNNNLFSSTDKVFQVRSANQAVVSLVSDLNSNGAKLGGIYFGRTGGQADNHVNTAGITAIQRGTGSLAGTDLSFWVKGTAAPVEFLRAMVSGSSDVRVGINTSSPQDRLHVEGNILSSGYYGAPSGSVVRVGTARDQRIFGYISPTSGDGSLTNKWFKLVAVTLSQSYSGFHLDMSIMRVTGVARAADILVKIGLDGSGNPSVDNRLSLSTPAWSDPFIKDIAVIQTNSNIYEIWLQMDYPWVGGPTAYTGYAYHYQGLSNATFTQGATDFVDTLPSPISGGLNIKWSDNTSANTRLIGYAALPDIGNRGRDILVARRVIYASNPSQSLLEIYKSDGWFTIPGRLLRSGLGSYGEQSVRPGATRVYRLEIGYTGNTRNVYDPSNTYWNNGYTTGAYWIRILKDSDGSEIFSQGISNLWASRTHIGTIRSIEVPSTSTLENAGSLRFQMGIFWDNNSPSWPTSNISGDNVPNNYLNYGKDTYLSVFSLVWEVYDRLP